MASLCLIGGIPPEPDTGDWDAVCAGPRPELFFAALLRECAQRDWSAPHITSDSEEDGWGVETGWYGTEAIRVEVTVLTPTASSDFPVRCRWQTKGIPGMSVLWIYALEYAGQLGHCAYRHRRLECTFATAADREAFAAVWRAEIQLEPEFGPCPAPPA